MRRTACCTAAGLILAAAITGCASAGAPTASTNPDSSCTTTSANAGTSLCLEFTGAVTATATSRIGVAPVETPSSIVAGPAPFTTQCVIATAGSDTTWQAQFTVATPNNKWMITISNGQNSGNPTPGRHALIGVFYPGKPPVGALGARVESRQPLAESLRSNQASSYVYTLGAKVYDVTVDPSLKSGSLDMTLAPAETNNPTVTVSGTWSCA